MKMYKITYNAWADSQAPHGGSLYAGGCTVIRLDLSSPNSVIEARGFGRTTWRPLPLSVSQVHDGNEFEPKDAGKATVEALGDWRYVDAIEIVEAVELPPLNVRLQLRYEHADKRYLVQCSCSHSCTIETYSYQFCVDVDQVCSFVQKYGVEDGARDLIDKLAIELEDTKQSSDTTLYLDAGLIPAEPVPRRVGAWERLLLDAEEL